MIPKSSFDRIHPVSNITRRAFTRISNVSNTSNETNRLDLTGPIDSYIAFFGKNYNTASSLPISYKYILEI